ncbi:transcriptional regulator, LacI family [Leifsonia sp. 98AMF]|uniref:LacI family DNA-binding transcriptional regulator n=1 Tax=unclassified Leifsonia TaxID=2663824 RepID=UPI00087DE964|nr:MULTISPECIES: LacI family DNA-binding transcriptional regulator [unclassified Leifsonia]SDH22051.1 transcriptional regulator, LacI family [Leifsonia sp. 197AMF]SDJ16461.1 transcriptional regulator, LacI family [Leifsonia sp. 466MF]SDJ51141.1 transcriptional regulator, LacI family [Leifsonia sp. 157MF]SDN37950.1 transcriptional regulator, LacI family [Leifsonia sp. 509MF]SEM83343.1 transcriptional regulator, LacI family [Leifsonia sp. 467MF]
MASASVKDVAALAQVSVGTVSNVLNRPEIVAPETVERVMSAMQKLSYVRNEAARQLRLGHSQALGLVTLSGGNPFFTDLATAAEDAAADAGYSVIVGNSNESTTRESGYLNLFEELRVRGVLLSPVGDPARRLRQLRDRGIAAVLVDRVSSDDSFSSVSVDDVAGGALAAAHLIRSGRTRLAFVGGPLQIRQVSDRLAGARQEVERHPGVSLEVVPVDALTVLEGRRAGEELVQRSANRRPDAVFAANDLIAVGLLQGLFINGRIRIPEDISLVGYDDIMFASASVVPLTSIRQPSALIGRTGVEILIEEAQDPELEPRHVLYQPELVVRGSSSADAVE